MVELLTFVVVGTDFTGVETVAEVNDLIHRALKYYPNIKHEEVLPMAERKAAKKSKKTSAKRTTGTVYKGFSAEDFGDSATPEVLEQGNRLREQVKQQQAR